jgi:hypothetical protein
VRGPICRFNLKNLQTLKNPSLTWFFPPLAGLELTVMSSLPLAGRLDKGYG